MMDKELKVVILFSVVIILAFSTFVYFYIRHADAEKTEFMQYCLKKGYSEQDCKWEYKRMNNGNRNNLIIMPMGR